MHLTDTYTLSNGVKIPIIGFGTWQVRSEEGAEENVLSALKVGYRHIDTAAAYQNEEAVGRAIAKSGIAREELFITTKLWNPDHGYEATEKAIDVSLSKLGLDYVDLYLIHWPNPLAFRENWQEVNAGSWKAMEEALRAGKTRAIGVSNFHPRHLDALLETAEITPHVNQILVNPSDQQEEIVAYNKAHRILTEAYSPLGTGKIFEVDALKTLANTYNKTVAQIVLRWSLQKGYLPLPKSVHENRMRENLALFDFSLTEEDVRFIDDLRGVAGLAKNPDEVAF